MEFTNELQRYSRDESGLDRATYQAAADALLLVLAPMTPHMPAEAWERRHGQGARLHAQSWPSFDPDLARAESVTMVVQVNGKLRDRIEVAPEISESDAVALALASERVAADLGGQEPKRIVARPPRLVNIVL
jgi:leucyl-tRNA synthetase